MRVFCFFCARKNKINRRDWVGGSHLSGKYHVKWIHFPMIWNWSNYWEDKYINLTFFYPAKTPIEIHNWRLSSRNHSVFLNILDTLRNRDWERIKYWNKTRLESVIQKLNYTSQIDSRNRLRLSGQIITF